MLLTPDTLPGACRAAAAAVPTPACPAPPYWAWTWSAPKDLRVPAQWPCREPICAVLEAPAPPTASTPPQELQACCSTAPALGKPSAAHCGPLPGHQGLSPGHMGAAVSGGHREAQAGAGAEAEEKEDACAPRLRTSSSDTASRSPGTERSGPPHRRRMGADDPVADSQLGSSTSSCPPRRAQRSQGQGACGHSEGRGPSS